MKNPTVVIELTDQKGRKIYMAGQKAEEIKKKKKTVIQNLLLESELQDYRIQNS